MDFDRTHKILLNLGYVTDEHWGVKIGKVYPFGDISIATFSYFQSGRPFCTIPGLDKRKPIICVHRLNRILILNI